MFDKFALFECAPGKFEQGAAFKHPGPEGVSASI